MTSFGNWSIELRELEPWPVHHDQMNGAAVQYTARLSWIANMNDNWTRRRWVQTLLASVPGISLARFAAAQEPEPAPARNPSAPSSSSTRTRAKR